MRELSRESRHGVDTGRVSHCHRETLNTLCVRQQKCEPAVSRQFVRGPERAPLRRCARLCCGGRKYTGRFHTSCPHSHSHHYPTQTGPGKQSNLEPVFLILFPLKSDLESRVTYSHTLLKHCKLARYVHYDSSSCCDAFHIFTCV